MSAAADGAKERDQELDRRLGTETPSLAALNDVLFDDYSAERWGFRRLASLEDEEQRAIASDLILSAVEGLQVNLRELALCDMDLQALVGPHGRLIPGADTTIDDIIEGKRLHRAITDLARALGSTIDCLAAATIGVLGLPNSLQLAAGSKLLSMPELPRSAPTAQHEARAKVQAVFAQHANAEPSGWLSWALEFRDAVVHRGHLSQTFLPRPGLSGARVEIRSYTPARYLRRFEPHLRARPWQPDMLSLTTPGAEPDTLWLPEPAHVTTTELKRRTVDLVEAMAGAMADVAAGSSEGWVFPRESWGLARDVDRARTVAASAFEGFDPNYPTPHVDAMAVHARSAARLELAERLRVRLTLSATRGDRRT